MAKLFSILLVLAASVAPVVNAAICVKNDTKFVGQRAAIVQERFQVQNSSSTFTIQGTAEILDGCSFIVRDFTFLPGNNNTVWYGRRENDPSSAIVAWGTANNVNSTIQTSVMKDSPIYTLQSTPAGQSASWNDIDTLVMFSLNDHVVLAKIPFTALTLNATTTTSIRAPTTTAAATTSSTKKAMSTVTVTRALSTATTAAPAATNTPPPVDATSSARTSFDLGSLALAGLAAVCVAAIGF